MPIHWQVNVDNIPNAQQVVLEEGRVGEAYDIERESTPLEPPEIKADT